MLEVQRFALVLLVGLLTASFSGAIEALVPEPCSPNETSSTPDGKCPPTCARCACCAQPVVPTPLVEVATQAVSRNDPGAIEGGLALPEPAEVFHVPRFLLA